MKKIWMISAIVIIALFVIFVSLINREDLSFESKYESVSSEVIKQDYELYVLQIVIPGCPAIQREGPNMKSDFEFLRENNIP